MNEEERAAIIREIAKKTVRYQMPGTSEVFERNAAYDAGGEDIPMAIYYPRPPSTGERSPAVVMAFGYLDPAGHVRQYGPVTSWARLIAASGVASVLYGTNEPAANIHAVLKHLRRHADTLGLDASRIGLFAASGNVPVALSAMMREPKLTCAALLYGYTMDLDGSTIVAEASAQALFVNACAGKAVDDLPNDVPMLVVRAGRDQFAGLNDALDAVVARALARNLPLTLVNHPTGVHGFEFEEDTDTSREIVTDVLSFFRAKLGVGR
jgi:hypothetical protein